MIFNSFQFVWLFPVIFVVYWVVEYFKLPKARRLPQIVLLIASYGLYMQWNPFCALILLYVTVATYLFAFLVAGRRMESRKRRFWLVTVGVILTLVPLFVFKYYNFISQAGASVLANIGIDPALPGLNWVVPLGLSFYTFQALGYLWEVYYGRLDVERNFLYYMLFVSFFPQLLCGPISTPHSLLPQIRKPAPFDERRAVSGLRLILWGMFLKVVLADRIGIYVDHVFFFFYDFSGSTCLLSAILYSFQIYGDFAGYSYMAVGVARLLGFDLVYNFMRPYFSVSVTEFWRRWNISLTRWLTTYIYIPLGGNRKGKWRTYINILITFLVSGIWHGANYTFIFWGLIHGVALCVERLTGYAKSTVKGWIQGPRILLTFAIVTVAWVFFRMPTIRSGAHLVVRSFTGGELFVDEPVLLNILIAFLVFLPVEFLLQYRNHRFKSVLSRYAVVRWTGYVVLTVVIMLFGVMDSSQFIYAKF